MAARRPHSKREEVRRFFRDNPTEELTHEDLMEKFSVGANTAYAIVKGLKAEGLIEAVHFLRKKSTHSPTKTEDKKS